MEPVAKFLSRVNKASTSDVTAASTDDNTLSDLPSFRDDDTSVPWALTSSPAKRAGAKRHPVSHHGNRVYTLGKKSALKGRSSPGEVKKHSRSVNFGFSGTKRTLPADISISQTLSEGEVPALIRKKPIKVLGEEATGVGYGGAENGRDLETAAHSNETRDGIDVINISKHSTNIGSYSGNVGTNIGTNIGGDIGTNIGGNIGGNSGTNIGSRIGTNIGSNIGTYIGGNIGRSSPHKPASEARLITVGPSSRTDHFSSPPDDRVTSSPIVFHSHVTSHVTGLAPAASAMSEISPSPETKSVEEALEMQWTGNAETLRDKLVGSDPLQSISGEKSRAGGSGLHPGVHVIPASRVPRAPPPPGGPGGGGHHLEIRIPTVEAADSVEEEEGLSGINSDHSNLDFNFSSYSYTFST